MVNLRRSESGAALRKQRRTLRLKQQAVALALGVSQATISRIETGAQLPDDYQLETLRVVLKLAPGEKK